MLSRAKNANEDCNSCASLAGIVLSFIACFILLVIVPLLVRPRNKCGIANSSQFARDGVAVNDRKMD